MSIRVDRRTFLVSSLAAALASRISKADSNQVNPPVLQITEIISGNRIPDEYATYYKVETNTSSWFYIARRKESKNQKVTFAVCDAEDKKQGRLFPKSNDPTTPVAMVDASGAGLNGVYKIYDKGDSYDASFIMSPLMSIPKHTEVSSNFLFNMDQPLRKMPPALITALNNNGTEVMIAGNIQDSYYRLYPGWKTEDENRKNDSSKPWIEKVNGQWIDNRKHSNTAGFYLPDFKKIVAPQKYTKYATDDIVNQADSKDWLQSLVFHEIGHALDYLKNPVYSDYDSFIKAYEKDMAKIPSEEEEKVGYFLRNRREPFAELVGALLGGLLPSSTARILNNFPEASEHIRKNVLPQYGYSISEEDVRKNIYPAYRLQKEASKMVSSIYDYRNKDIQYDQLCC